MWQRLQTLYMMLAMVFLGLMPAFPVSKFSGDNFSGQLFIYGLKPLNGVLAISMDYAWVLSVVVLLCIVMIVVAVLQFKKRATQLRMIMIAVLLNIVLIGLLFFFNDRLEKMDSVFGTVSYQTGAFFPLLSLVFLLVASRLVKRDEAKVRASNRLR